MSEPSMIAVEIVEAFADRVARETVRVPADACVRNALAIASSDSAKRALAELESIDHIADSNVGIWGRRVLLDSPLADGDRIELYRVVMADAKSARLVRAREQGYRWQGRTRRAAKPQSSE
ncbi:MAG: RnfH family protein [Casimicrobium sp.]